MFIDELWIFFVYGLLYVFDYDYELGLEVFKEMEEEENCIFSVFGWKVKGFIYLSFVVCDINGKIMKGLGLVEFDFDCDSVVILKIKFKVLFCDMDGIFFNIKSKII